MLTETVLIHSDKNDDAEMVVPSPPLVHAPLTPFTELLVWIAAYTISFDPDTVIVGVVTFWLVPLLLVAESRAAVQDVSVNSSQAIPPNPPIAILQVAVMVLLAFAGAFSNQAVATKPLVLSSSVAGVTV